MTNQNQDTYSTANIVNYYEQLQLLQPAEKTILERLRPQLSTMDMLDIGVGGGRTTQHFAPLVKSYVGIDYSVAMIEACKRRFDQSPNSLNFSVGDARNMAEFADNSFDFILFSFNGIDYVDHGDRLKIFQEIKRIGRPNCYVFFSSHNLQAMETEFQWQTKISFNPLSTYINLVMLALLRLFNWSITPQKIALSNHLIIRDESHNFRLETYYIRNKEQVIQLAEYFNNIEVYSWQSGLVITEIHDSSLMSDAWLYYLCEI